jgi:parvulin-like peptidyl-prolyl isomerase
MLWLLIVSSFELAGCNSVQKKHDNPVMVAAPRRVDAVDQDENETKYVDQRDATKTPVEDDGSDVMVVRGILDKSKNKNPWKDWEDDTTIFNSQVAATVNGAPILNGDILDRYAGYLISVREAMQKLAANPQLAQPGQPIPTPEDYEKIRYSAIQRDIASHIQKKLLVERMKGSLKPEQLKQMQGHIDQLFEKECERLKGELKVSNKTELELELNKKGTTLQNVKDNFALDRLSVEFIVAKSEKPEPLERPDLVEYYQSNPDKFLVSAKVKWQQIQISISPDVGRSAAQKKLDAAVAEINRGVAFDKVARKYSDGPTAKDGGEWDWMEAGNLADVKLEKKLFELPVNELSEVHENRDSLTVVRVTARQNAGRKPFEEVQEEIRTILVDLQNKNRPKKLFRELFSQAVIESQYSLPQFVPEE